MSDGCFSTDEEIFRDENEEDVVDAIISGFEDPYKAVGVAYWESNPKRPSPSSMFRIQWLIEEIQENAWDNYGEFAEDFLNDLPNEKVEELEKLIVDWLDSNVNVSFWQVHNTEERAITKEMVDKYVRSINNESNL